MLLSDNENRDIIKYLEADKPIPEKYRFLLFEANREIIRAVNFGKGYTKQLRDSDEGLTFQAAGFCSPDEFNNSDEPKVFEE